MNLNNKISKKNNFYNLNSLYLGYDADKDEKEFVNILRKKYVIEKTKNAVVAKYLSQGLIMGRCVGKMEFGPRSLGNRAILADPRNPNTKDKINRAIKNRDFWMPFAPSVLDKCAKKYLYFYEKFKSPHMSTTYMVRKPFENFFLAAAHPADKTVRAQIVTEETNTEYFDLINEFYKITKFGAILNTSFNLHGFPVVRTLKDALYVFENSDLDILLTKNFIIKKNVTNKKSK
jgi:carbamoyltransferase